MTASQTSRTVVEHVPAMMVALLEQAGDLPPVPERFAVDRGLLGFREPSLDDGNRLGWLIAWHGPRTEGFAFRKPAGILGYEDCYDFHSASDVRVVSYLAGSPRAVIELVRTIRRAARADGRRLIGSVDLPNEPLASVLDKMGFARTRVVFEDRE